MGWTELDKTLILGVAPLGFLGHPKHFHQLGVRGVVSMLDEVAGPQAEYQKLGITQLRLPTIDHCEPTVENLMKACEFIDEHRKNGTRVYVHCKAGHGRAGAVALAWLAYSRRLYSDADLKDLNEELLRKRNVRRKLYSQANIKDFAARAIAPLQDAPAVADDGTLRQRK